MAKRTRGSAWRVLDFGASYPKCAGCYVIYVDGEIVYVGSSECVGKRLYAHPFEVARYSNHIETPWGTSRNVLIKYRPCRKYGDWAMVELRLIRRLRPKHNRNHNSARRIRA